MDPRARQIFEAATRPYREAGRYAWHFARGKLRHDPVFFSLLRRGLLPDRGQLVDLGCGQGVLLSLLAAAKQLHAAGRWPPDWPPPPAQLVLRGLDADPRRVQAARRALGAAASVERGDVREFDFRPCSAIVMLDVLLYLSEAEQERLLDRAADALEPGGLLLLREPDAGAGLPFRLTKLSAQLDALLRGSFALPPLCFRSAARWVAGLAQRGLAVETAPMSQGTPFANVLFAARKVV